MEPLADRHIGASPGGGRASRTEGHGYSGGFCRWERGCGPKENRDVSVSTGPGAAAPGGYQPRHRPLGADGPAEGGAVSRARRGGRLACTRGGASRRCQDCRLDGAGEAGEQHDLDARTVSGADRALGRPGRRGGVAIHAALARKQGYRGSYSAVRRMLAGIRGSLRADLTVPLYFAPAEAAQVDFGAGPFLFDPVRGALRRTWCFVMTLCFSRHQYVEFVFDQTVMTWLGSHRPAFGRLARGPGRVSTASP